MPVGPLSLSDEVALDLGLKVIRATEADLGPNAVNPDQKKLMIELVEKQNRLGRKNGKGFYDYPEKGKGQKSLWPGLAALQPKKLDPDTLSRPDSRPTVREEVGILGNLLREFDFTQDPLPTLVLDPTPLA